MKWMQRTKSVPKDETKIRIEVMDYTPEHLMEKNEVSVEECCRLKAQPSPTWINVHGVHNAPAIQAICSHFGLHPLITEDIMSEQRSKFDDYKENLFMIIRMLKYDPKKGDVEDEQVSIVLAKDHVISFVDSDRDVFEPVRNRLRNPQSRLRNQGVDYLAYSLIDVIVDHYFEILEKVDQQLEDMEETVLKKPGSATMMKIQSTKRQMATLRKAVWPMREVLSNFRRVESPLVHESTKLYIQDAYDHTIQAIETIENFRDIVSGMFDIYMSNINLRMNEIMKVLTIVATIFVPLTFVASVYGMNFDYIPGLHSIWGYYICLVIMVLIALGMVLYFRHKKWI